MPKLFCLLCSASLNKIQITLVNLLQVYKSFMGLAPLNEKKIAAITLDWALTDDLKKRHLLKVLCKELFYSGLAKVLG